MTPLWGRLAAIIGRRQAILASMALFCAGTAGCALAPSMGAVLASRFVSGCGGGGLLTVTAIIVSDLVSLQERGLYQVRARPPRRTERLSSDLDRMPPFVSRATSTCCSRPVQRQEPSSAASSATRWAGGKSDAHPVLRPLCHPD
jgi:hypothetical protein